MNIINLNFNFRINLSILDMNQKEENMKSNKRPTSNLRSRPNSASSSIQGSRPSSAINNLGSRPVSAALSRRSTVATPIGIIIIF